MRTKYSAILTSLIFIFINGAHLSRIKSRPKSYEFENGNNTVTKEIDFDSLKTLPVKAVPISPTPKSIGLNETREIISSYSNGAVSLNDLLNIWNPYDFARFSSNRVFGAINLSVNCAQDVRDFTQGLLAGERWALKMVDATGRHAWGLFSGNKFWLGAADQCREIGNDFLEWQRGQRTLRDKFVPPFHVGLSSVNFTLNIFQTEFNESYNVYLGLCLPQTCDSQDLEKLILFNADNSRGDIPRNVTIHSVRKLANGFSIWEDPFFHILFIVCILSIILTISGTLYDIVLRYQVLCKEYKKQEKNVIMAEIGGHNGTIRNKITIGRLWAVKEHNGSLDVANPNVPKPLSEALLSFSLLLNISKLCSLDVGNDTLAPIHGLRFYSMLWIIFVHGCMFISEISDTKRYRSQAESGFFYQTISNGTYSVDTFFLISGCLVSFLYYRTMSKENMRKMKITKGCHGQFLQFFGMMWYRYLRLTPTYVLVLSISYFATKWYHATMMIDLFLGDYENCENYWWRNVLYINTYYKHSEYCFNWSWYLANDTQFYTVGIILLIIGASFFPIAAFTTFSFLIASWIVTGVVAYNTKHVPSIEDPFAHFESLYDKPWARIGPYLIGMMAGWYLYKTNCKLEISKTFFTVFWTSSVAVMLSIVYGLYGNTFGPILSIIYTTFSHSGWAVAVAWILIACVTGHGGVVNKILSWKYLYPVSRLTYCVYLVHPVVMRLTILNAESSIHPSHMFTAVLFCGFTVVSYGASLLISLLFEAPMVSLLRIAHPLRQWKSSET